MHETRYREYNKAFTTAIEGTELHEEIKRQKRGNWSVYMDSISEQQLEARKEFDRGRKAIDFI